MFMRGTADAGLPLYHVHLCICFTVFLPSLPSLRPSVFHNFTTSLLFLLIFPSIHPITASSPPPLILLPYIFLSLTSSSHVSPTLTLATDGRLYCGLSRIVKSTIITKMPFGARFACFECSPEFTKRSFCS